MKTRLEITFRIQLPTSMCLLLLRYIVVQVLYLSWIAIPSGVFKSHREDFPRLPLGTIHRPFTFQICYAMHANSRPQVEWIKYIGTNFPFE